MVSDAKTRKVLALTWLTSKYLTYASTAMQDIPHDVLFVSCVPRRYNSSCSNTCLGVIDQRIMESSAR
eukprot:scaffold160011_cov10-Prasinocladus_malaysianus.AAC.1